MLKLGKWFVLSLCSAFLVSGCSPHRSSTPKTTISKVPINYPGRTIIFYDGGHGTQIEYFSPKGQAYLWYPGNAAVVVGNWKLENQNICFRYGRNTYNPITKQSGGRWQCTPSYFHRYSAKKACNGDAFKLSSGKIPFRLMKQSYQSPKIIDKCNDAV